MGRYKDYDRGAKRGDDGQSLDQAFVPEPTGPRSSGSAERRPPPSSQVTGETSECVGIVKMYKMDKGFGFVGQNNGGKDVFIHASALARAGLNGLVEGQRVRMQIGQGQKGLEARSIELLD